MKLLSRDEFRESVFKRDNHQCVMCGEPAVDAHHILERKLFTDGGYYLDNGASLCSVCHLKAEETKIGAWEIRWAIDVLNPILPRGFEPSYEYDKWGNLVMPDGRRLRGPMYDSEAFQTLLKRNYWLRTQFEAKPYGSE